MVVFWGFFLYICINNNNNNDNNYFCLNKWWIIFWNIYNTWEYDKKKHHKYTFKYRNVSIIYNFRSVLIFMSIQKLNCLDNDKDVISLYFSNI